MEYNNIIDFNKYDFSTTPVIKPPTQQERDNFTNNSLITQKLIMIDSRDRNTNLYKNNNDFIIELDEPIDDVYEVELVSANMPINSYNINQHNNRLYFFKNTISFNNNNNTNLSLYDNSNLYNNDIIDKSKIFYIKIIPNNYSNFKSIIDYLKFNNHIVYKLSDNQINGVASFFITNNNTSSKYNILIFHHESTSLPSSSSDYIYDQNLSSPSSPSSPLELNTTDAIKNSIIFRGDRFLYNQKIMYNYLPNSAHEIFGFDLNYGFINNDYNNDILSKTYFDYNLHFEPPNLTNTTTDTELSRHYESSLNIYTYDSTSEIIKKTINGLTANLDIGKKIYVNISNTMATNKVNEYVLLHLPNFPKMTNKIASNSIVQNAYAKLHLGTGTTRNIFFGRIKAFTNVYNLNSSIKLSKIHIKITDSQGNLFNFNNCNFTLTFSITHNKQPYFYNY